MADEFFKWHFYIISSHDSAVVPESAALDEPNKILIFISDEFGEVNAGLGANYDFIFKSYITSDYAAHKTYSFPLGYVRGFSGNDGLAVQKRDINIYFSGNLNKNRVALYRQFARIPKYLSDDIFFYSAKLGSKVGVDVVTRSFYDKERNEHIFFSNKFKGGVTLQRYSTALSNSKIVLCPKGFHSVETFRHMEALRSGCIVISEKLPNTLWYRNSPIIQVDNWDMGLRTARDLINKPDALKELSHRSSKWWKSVCSEPAVANYMAGTLCQQQS